MLNCSLLLTHKLTAGSSSALRQHSICFHCSLPLQVAPPPLSHCPSFLDSLYPFMAELEACELSDHNSCDPNEIVVLHLHASLLLPPACSLCNMQQCTGISEMHPVMLISQRKYAMFEDLLPYCCPADTALLAYA